jgi:predicted DNA-binding transcriptional regulator AlpA
MTPLRAHNPEDDTDLIPIDAEPQAARADDSAEAAPRRYARPNRPAAPETLTIPLAGVASMLGVSARTLERMIALGDFPKPIRVGKQRMYRRSSVERWLTEAEADAERSPRARRR